VKALSKSRPLHLLPNVLVLVGFAAFALLPYYRLLSVSGNLGVNEIIIPKDWSQLQSYIARQGGVWDSFASASNFNPSTAIISTIFLAPFAALSANGAYFLVFTQFLSMVGAFALAKRIARNYVSAFVSSILYAFSPYIFNEILANTYVIPYAVFPLAVLASINGFSNKELGWSIVAGILIAVLVGLTLPIGAFALLMCVSWYSIECISKHSWSKVRHLTFRLIVIFVLVVSLNMYWIAPALFRLSATGVVRPDITFFSSPSVVVFWSQYLLPSQVLLQDAPGWFRSLISGSLVTPNIITAMVLSVLPSAAMLVRRTKYTVLFSLLYSLGMAFALGVNEPIMGRIYVYLYTHFIPFVAFDRPYFFLSLVALVSSVLAALVFSRILETKKRKFVALSLIILVLIPASTVVRVYPITSGNFDGLLGVIPAKYDQMRSLLGKLPDGRVLLLPSSQTGGVWPETGRLPFLNPIVMFPTQPFIGRSGYSNDLTNYAIIGLSLNRFANLSSILDILGVRYIYIDTSQLSFGYPYENLPQIIHYLNQSTNIELADRNGSQLLYRNNVVLPNAYLSGKVALVFGNLGLIPSLTSFPSYDPKKLPLIFADGLDPGTSNSVLSAPGLVIIQDGNFSDVAQTIGVPDSSGSVRLDLVSYVGQNGNSSPDWFTKGKLSSQGTWYTRLLDGSVPDYLYSTPGSWVLTVPSSTSNSSLEIPFQILHSGSYDVSVRVFEGWFSSNGLGRGYASPNISVSIDGRVI
jgi:hypothetical protein